MENPTTRSRFHSSFSVVFVILILEGSVPLNANNTTALIAPTAADVALQLAAYAPAPWAGFGFAVSAVPDVNGDGKWNVAVSSMRIRPWKGPKESGKVTLFVDRGTGARGILYRRGEGG